MKVVITTRHFELPQAVRGLIDKKQRKFEKYADKIIKCELVLARESTNFIAEGKIDLKYGMLTSRARNPDLGVAVTSALNKLFAQLHKEDEKIKEKWKRGKRLR